GVTERTRWQDRTRRAHDDEQENRSVGGGAAGNGAAQNSDTTSKSPAGDRSDGKINANRSLRAGCAVAPCRIINSALLRRNCCPLATSGMGLGRVKTLEGEGHIERPFSPAPMSPQTMASRLGNCRAR